MQPPVLVRFSDTRRYIIEIPNVTDIIEQSDSKIYTNPSEWEKTEKTSYLWRTKFFFAFLDKQYNITCTHIQAEAQDFYFLIGLFFNWNVYRITI